MIGDPPQRDLHVSLDGLSHQQSIGDVVTAIQQISDGSQLVAVSLGCLLAWNAPVIRLDELSQWVHRSARTFRFGAGLRRLS